MLENGSTGSILYPTPMKSLSPLTYKGMVEEKGTVSEKPPSSCAWPPTSYYPKSMVMMVMITTDLINIPRRIFNGVLHRQILSLLVNNRVCQRHPTLKSRVRTDSTHQTESHRVLQHHSYSRSRRQSVPSRTWPRRKRFYLTSVSSVQPLSVTVLRSQGRVYPERRPRTPL